MSTNKVSDTLDDSKKEFGKLSDEAEKAAKALEKKIDKEGQKKAVKYMLKYVR